MEALNKLALYLKAAAALRSPNFRGLPLFPKSLAFSIPRSRAAYNTFVLWIQKFRLDRPSVILDVGANHGDFALAASQSHPQARILLFEPLPQLQPRLNRLAAAHPGKWTLFPCGLGACQANLPLFVDEANDTIGSFVGFSSDYLAANPAAKQGKPVVVEVRTLDDVTRQAGIDGIDLMKIDVEGFEFDVLKGAAESLKRTGAVVIEVSLVRDASHTGNQLLEMLSLLANSGFHVVDVIPSLYAPGDRVRPVEFNVLAARPLAP